MDITNTKKISCYAVLRSGYTGENYLLSHMRLVLLLVFNKKYKIVEPERLIEDFEHEYHYSIGYFPMRKILSLAVLKGYLEKSHNRKKFTPTQKISEYKSVKEELSKSEETYTRLIQSFIDFCDERAVKYSKEEAESIVNSYFNSQKLEHITGHIESEIKDKRIDYLFGQFVFFVHKDAPELFEYINSMVVGAILADCLVFHEMLDNNKQLEGVTVVFDTTPVFIALGIDEAGRKDYYCDLLDSLRQKGARLAMFDHSYDEMQNILQGSQEWIDNINYDPSKSSNTTEYFRSIGAKKEDVEEFALMLKEKITGLGIEIINYCYIPEDYPYHVDFSHLYSLIVEQYKSTNPLFNEEAQKNSIELDVKSISMIYLLRHGQKPVQIPDVSFLFVTANQSIAQVAFNFHEENYKDKTIPPVLTDVFLGTYIWLSDPMQIDKMNEQQIMSQAYLAFQPNSILLEKLSTTVAELMDKGEIDSKVCYALRGSRLVSEKLARKTLGDPDAFTDMTPFEILQEIRDEAKAEERDRIKTEENERQKLRDIESKKAKDNYEKNLKIVEQERDELRRELQLKDKNRYNELLVMKNDGDKYRHKWMIFVIALAISFGVILVGSIIIFFFFRRANWYSPFISIIPAVCTLLPIVFSILMFLCKLVKGEKVSLLYIVNLFLDKEKNRKLKKLGYSQEEFDKLLKKIDENEVS